MSLRTTLLLLLLTAAGAFAWWRWDEVSSWVGIKEASASADAVGPRAVVPNLTPNSIQSVEVTNAHGRFTLQKDKSGLWALPGNWPTRQSEAQSLIDLLTQLETRFASIPLDSAAADLRRFGLDPSQQPVTVVVVTNIEPVRLVFGEPETPGVGPFARPTYLRVIDRPEVFRLGPDLLTVLRRPREFYQRRQLFPEAERVRFAEARSSSNPFAPTPESGSGSVLIPRARQIVVQGAQGRLVLRSVAGEKAAVNTQFTVMTTPELLAESWEIVEPVSDRADPEKLKNLLSAVPNLWVDAFTPLLPPTFYPAMLSLAVGDHWASCLAGARLALEPLDSPWSLQQAGVNPPEYQIALTRASGDVTTLLLGRISRVVERPGTPPPTRPGMPPLPPTPVREEYRYARLEGQPLLFEVKADKLNDLFPSLATFRDARLARFQTADATELRIRTGQETITIRRDKSEKSSDKWKIIEPLSAIAESSKVTELLDKLAALESRDQDVLDTPDLAKAGLESAAVQVTVQVEEEIPAPTPGGNKEKRQRAITLEFGAKESVSNKVHVRVVGQKRVNLVDESAFTLASRPALAYRGRRILDFDTAKVARIEVKRSAETFVLEQLDREWKLTAPVMASAERFKASDLASDLARLEAVEYVNDQPTPEQLASYGLDQPQLTVQVTLSDSAEPPHVLLVGKQREMQPEFFAKLATSPSVFVIRKDLRDRLDQDSLSYRVKDLWTLTAEDIAQLTIERGTDRVELRREAGAWRITQPFDAPANQTEVRPILDSLASLRIEGYEAHTTDELDGYGLGQPALRLSFSAREGTGDRAHGSRHWTLLLGKPVPGKSEIYAKREDEPAIFRIADPLLRQAGRTALDLLDRRVLSVERRRVGKLERSGSVNWSATREGESWKIQAGDLSFIADQPTIDATLRTLETLLADRVAAYGPEVKLDEYGLQSPVDSLTVVLSGNSGDSTAKHVLRFGKEADGGGRYAAVDDSKAVFVVSAATARELTRGHLDYADRTLLKLEGAPIQTIRRVMKENDLELSRAGGWKITKPAEFAADEALLDGLTKTLSAWRAERVAAYQPGDLKPFGLDEPTAVLTIEFGEAGKTSQKIVKVGGPVDAMNPAGERYITVESSPIVGVVDSVMAKRLLAEPIAFRDRQLVRRMPEPDKATLQRGERKATFVKSQGTWRMTEPIATDAEHADLEEFVNSLYRLRADELVAEKPTPEKLAEYGLDSPSAVWRFYSGEKEVLALLLGKRDSTDQRVYARLGDGDIVFLLTPAVTTRATAEYRKRAAFLSFDAAQVELLTLAGDSGEIVLRKVDGVWKIEGQPDASVKQQAVTDILGALASLKAQEFVRDHEAPKEIFGLSQPKRRIVARTNSGQTAEIWLGNFQGGSQRAYACLPTRSDVFTLSEADTAKLLAEVK